MKNLHNRLSRYGSSVPSSLFYGSGIPGDVFGSPLAFLSPDDDGGGAGGAGDNAGGEGDNSASGDSGADDPTKLFTPEQQAVFNKAMAKQKRDAEEAIKVATAKAEDAARQRIAAETEKAQKAAETRKQQEQGEWQKVAENREIEIRAKDDEIAALKPRAEAYDAIVASKTEEMNEKIKKFLPEVQALDPGADPLRFEERLQKFPTLLALQERLNPSGNFDTDLGKSGGGRGSNPYDRIRAEEKARQERESTQTKTLDQRLGRVGASS